MTGPQTTQPRELASVTLIAHRGASHSAPENTQAAFDAALACPIDGIEFDVQLTKDLIPVIFHDKTLARTAKIRKRISDLNFAELAVMDFGGWYSEAFQYQRCMSLTALLQRYYGKTLLFIELKSRVVDRKHGRSAVLTRHVLEIIHEFCRDRELDTVHLLSFDLEILKLANQLAPNLKYILNLDEPFVGDRIRQGHFPSFLYGLGTSIHMLNGELVDYSHRCSHRVLTYSCNIRSQLDKVLRNNVDIILTDKPEWITRLRQEQSN